MADPTYDGAEIMSKATGIPKAEVNQIWENVKANFRALEGCAKHQFEPVPKYPDNPSHPLKDYKCTRCGGQISATDHAWYQRGLLDGAKSDPS